MDEHEKPPFKVSIDDADWARDDRVDQQLNGAELIADFVTRLPHQPGVYRMLNESEDVLYVGKARDLKKRVSSYTKPAGHSGRILRMIMATCSMEFIVTRTETEALLLEANLIKRLRPHFNVLLRDDKSFPYILMTSKHPSPGLFKHRGARSREGKYYGPFASAGAVNRTINALQRAFLIRTCTDSVFDSRTRPCLLYQIKRCAGPCTGEIDEIGYSELVKEANQFLSGHSQSVKAQINEAMNAAAEELDYERAAVLRDRLTALAHVQGHQDIHTQSVEDADIFAIHQQGGQNCIEVFFYRTGQNWGNRAFFPRADAEMEEAEVLAAFIAQFYDNKPCPRTVLTSHRLREVDLLQEALSLRLGKKVQVLTPARGEKRQLVVNALNNAREALGRRLSENASQARLLSGFAETFGMDQPPRRIEVYDNSHTGGTNAVGAMIVAGPSGFAKAHYRKFNIKSKEIAPGDDLGMMREVLSRRFGRLIKQRNEAANAEPGELTDDELPDWPDVLLIDGGAGQIGSVLEVLQELEIDDQVVLIGVAKGMDRDAGREQFVIPGQTPFSLPPRDPVLYFVQRLRDEAHRFAIGSHRARRQKAMLKNPLDEIDGIGPSRKRALLAHFGTAKEVSRASQQDLRGVEGISKSMAKMIYDHFHPDGSTP